MKFINLISNKFVAFTSFIIGIIWFLLLSQFEFNQRTYMSENALLVGLIKQQFNNRSAIDSFYHDIAVLSKNGDSDKTRQWIKDTMDSIGLETGMQNFTFKYDKLLNNQKFDGQNVYGILRSPGAARMQGILITVPLRYGGDNVAENQPLLSSVGMILALAQHARGKLYWATDVIFLFTEMEYIGLKAYLNAYHGLNDTNDYIEYQSLTDRSGSLLAGFNVEIASSRIPYLEFRVESLNGQLPNLDLYNAFVRLAQSMEIPVRIHGVSPPISSSITSRQNGLKSYLSMMWYQSFGSPNGLHGLLADFQIPSLTVFSPVQSRISPKTNLFEVTRLLESVLRSLNGLQERMHQSFFFYLLPSPLNYVSIGMYMLPFGLMCISVILFQVIGAVNYFQLQLKEADKINSSPKTEQENIFEWWNLTIVTITSLSVGVFTNWCLDHFLSYSHKFQVESSLSLLIGSISICGAVMLFCRLKVSTSSNQSIVLLKTSLQLSVGLFLGTLSVLNISMAFFFALALVPGVVFIYPFHNGLARLLCKLYLVIISPLSLIFVAALIHHWYFIPDADSDWTNFNFYTTALTTTRNWMLQAWLERDVLGNWTLDIYTFCYLPIWVMMWCVACMPPAKR